MQLFRAHSLWSILTCKHKEQDGIQVGRTSTNIHRQEKTLYLESLKYGVILYAKWILKTIETDV